MSLFVLQSPHTPGWGDYSDILIAGLAFDRDPENGMLQLERTGPFIPPITLPDANVVVTEGFKTQLEDSGLSGLDFWPVFKKRIVHLEWERWDLSADEPKEYPKSGEPEDYILRRKHSPQIAELMGALWELRLEYHAELIPYRGLSNWDGTDWFRAIDMGGVLVSSRAKEWLERCVPEWVSFREAVMWVQTG